MATTTFQFFASGYNMPAGAVHHWWWNNAPNGRVWLFEIQPYVQSAQYDYFKGRAEVVRVEQRVKLNPPEREIHVWVKNTDPIFSIHYDIYMATIRP